MRVEQCLQQGKAEAERLGVQAAIVVVDAAGHLRWTRIKRWGRCTICFAKTEYLYDLVMGRRIHCYEFGRLG